MIFRKLFGSGGDDEQPGASADASGMDATDQADLMIMEQLRAMGADLSKPREVLHYLYLPTEEAANEAGTVLREHGYAVDVRPAAGPPGPNPWLVHATNDEVVTIESVRAARAIFTSLATQHGGEYDGWEAAGVP